MLNPRYTLAVILAIPAICSAQTISAGLWQLSLQVQSAAAAMPPLQANQCLTDADAMDPSKLLSSMASPGASGCTYSDRRYSANTFRFTMACAGTFAIKATGDVSFTATTMSGTISTSANINGQPVNMQNSVTAQRIGDC
jgi:hypothetical protein